MRHRSYCFVQVLLLLALLPLSACGGPAQPSVDLVAEQPAPNPAATVPSAQPKAFTIGLVMKTLTNPFFVEMEKGARQAEKDYGINLVVRTGAQETSIEQQIAIVRDMIKENVDAIVIAPADSSELIPVLKEAQDAGVFIVNIDNQLNPTIAAQKGLQNVPYISVDNEQGAYKSAKVLSDQITSPTEVAILEGIRTAQNAEDRKNGAQRAFAENPNVQLVAAETANWQIDEAHDVIESIFADHPQIKAVFAANDMMALGVIQYLNEAGRADVLVAAYDALDEAKKAIRTGTLQATVDQQAALQGYQGVAAAMRLLQGEPVEPLTLVDTMLITKDNVNP